MTRPASQLASSGGIIAGVPRDMDNTSFTDSSGIRWSVREDGADDGRVASRADGAPGTAWLRFESDLEVRRLWHYPDDWRGLNPLQLESLLERASTVIARFRPVGHRRPSLDSAGSPESPPRASELEARAPRPAANAWETRPNRSDDPDSF